LVARLAGAMVAIFALDKSASGFVEIFGANRAARIVDSVHINNIGGLNTKKKDSPQIHQFCTINRNQVKKGGHPFD